MLPLVIATALIAFPASAALTTTSSTSIDGTSVVANDSEGGGYYNSNVSLSTGYFSQFNPNVGVLTGATINVTGTQMQYTRVSSTSGAGLDFSTVTSIGSGNSTVTVSAPGAAHTFGTLAQSASCTGWKTSSCPGNWFYSTASTSWNGAVASGSLNSYVGGLSVQVVSNANLQAQQLNDVFFGTETTSSQVILTSTVASATYTYLLHAAPSFSAGSSLNTLTLDFGTVNQNASVGPLGFSLFNLSNANRVGLDLDGMSLVAGTDTTALTSNLASFAGLAQGGNASFQAMLNTANVGNFSETYLLTLSDADVGASATRSTYYLTLTMTGTVAAVPEPETWAMLLAGLGLVGAAATRRKTANV